MTEYTEKDEDTGLTLPGSATIPFAESAAPVLALPAFDAATYRAHIAPFALTEKQERELLETLWSIMYTFVELGFTTDVYSAVFGSPEMIAAENADVVGSLQSTFAETSSTNLVEEGPA